jgi:hypothetical protein
MTVQSLFSYRRYRFWYRGGIASSTDRRIECRYKDRDGFAPVLLTSIALAALGSIAGSWAWTIASKRLPIGLASQLIASQWWPAWEEACGVACMVIGVVAALRAFQRDIGNGPAESPAVGAPVASGPADLH